MSARSVPPTAVLGESLLDLLDLESIDRDLFRANTVVDEPFPLFGGQVAAQALVAAGRTVSDGRLPHSMHGYFLRSGDATRPVVFRVDRDRDGGSFSARRVVAMQDGEVLFSMAASFQTPEEGLDRQVEKMPVLPAPEALESLQLPRVLSFEARMPPQPYETGKWPTRFWARCTEKLPSNELLHAAVLTYISDILNGLIPLVSDGFRPGPSLDHAVWFHRSARLDDWVLVDFEPGTTSRGRGWYTGNISSPDGVLCASVAQECLFREKKSSRGKTAGG